MRRVPIDPAARAIPIPKWGLVAMGAAVWIALLLIAIANGKVVAFAVILMIMGPGGWVLGRLVVKRQADKHKRRGTSSP